MERYLKRFIDVAAAVIGLIILSPIMALIPGLIWLRMGSPVFFRQVRPGLHGKPFTLVKFRTMSNECLLDGTLRPDCDRLTPLGATLRRLSLDELPQLWNVLKGDLSLVGPRPLLMQYLDRYTPEQARRHDVKPGITGWAQVNGRNALCWEEKFALDLYYVDKQSLLLDMKILAMTFWAVVSGRGISQEGQATMTEFMGSCTPNDSGSTASAQALSQSPRMER